MCVSTSLSLAQEEIRLARNNSSFEYPSLHGSLGQVQVKEGCGTLRAAMPFLHGKGAQALERAAPASGVTVPGGISKTCGCGTWGQRLVLG